MSKCVFCDRKMEGGTSFRRKPICEDCFDEIFEWAFNGRVNKKLEKIIREIKSLLRREAK